MVTDLLNVEEIKRGGEKINVPFAVAELLVLEEVSVPTLQKLE